VNAAVPSAQASAVREAGRGPPPSVDIKTTPRPIAATASALAGVGASPRKAAPTRATMSGAVPPGDRVHLPEVAERVGADQEQLVAGVQQRRSREPGPGGRGGQGEKRQERQGEPALHQRQQQHGGEPVEADLHHRVPARVHQRRREHRGEHGRVHPQAVQAGRGGDEA